MTGETEFLSFGSPAPPRVPRLVVVAGLLTALVVGYLVGVRGDEVTPAVADRAEDEPGLVAGSVREGPDAWERISFELVLHNPGPEPVVVYVERVGPIEVQRDAIRGPVRVTAGSTALVDVEAPRACDHLDAPFTTVTAAVDSGAGRRTTTIPLLDATDLRDYLDGVCRAPTSDLRASALEGVWSLDGRPLLLWFRPDGTFVADGRGRLFTERSGWRGRYRLGGGLLRMETDAGAVCEAGEHVTWQVHRRTSRLLDLRFVEGSCPDEPGGPGTVRQVLTSVPAGVDW